MANPAKIRITANEYFELPEYHEHDFIQLIDGEVIIPMPPVLKHQIIVGNIFFLFKLIVKKLGGLAFVAPTEVKLDEDNVYEPDVIYISADNISIAEQDDNRIVGAPDLIVEVLSPGTARYDRQQKYKAYEKFAVREYWIVDPIHETVEVWLLNPAIQYERQGAYSIDDSFNSSVLASIVSVQEIFDGTSKQEDS